MKYPSIDSITDCIKPQTFLFADDGKFPNSRLPLLLYRQVIDSLDEDTAAQLEERFASHDWTNSWRNGVYSFVHYHSNTAEVLGVYRGSAQLSFGGEPGEALQVSAGDVIVIPAGVPHQNLGASPDFGVVGAYPEGRSWNVLRGLPDERPGADRDIANLPLPKTDPVYGEHGPLVHLWRSRAPIRA